MMKTNELIQWAGTVCVLSMYAAMNLAPQNTQLTQLLGLLGALCFGLWCIRVGNRPQLIINTAAVVLCVVGLARGLV